MSAAVETNSPTAHSPSSDSPSHRGSPPLSNKTLTGEALHSALVAQLEWYFSRENLQRDAWLVSQLQGSGWVPIDVICSFRKVERLTTERAAVVAAMKSCKSIMLDAAQTAVRPSAKAERNTLILRDISSELPQEQVRTIFAADGCPGTVTSLRSDVGDCWFVVFENEHQCTETALWLVGRKFQDNEIHARVKSVAVSNPSVMQATAMNMHANTGGSITTPLAAPQSLNQHNQSQTTLPNNQAVAGAQSNDFYYPPQQPFMFAYPPQFYGQGNYPQQQQAGQGYQPKGSNPRFNNQSPNQYPRPMNGAPRSNNQRPRNHNNNKKGGYQADGEKPRRASRSPEDGDAQPVPLDSMQFPSLAASLPDETPATAAVPEREASPAPVAATAAPVTTAATDASPPSASSPTSASGPKGWASIVNSTKPAASPATAQTSSPTPKTVPAAQSNNQGKKTTKTQREENNNHANGDAPVKAAAPATKAAAVAPAAATAAPATSAASKNYAKMVGSMPAADAAKLAEQLKAARDAKEAQKRPATTTASPPAEKTDAPAVAASVNEKRESERFQRWSEKRERQEKKAIKVAPVNGTKDAPQVAQPVAASVDAPVAAPQTAPAASNNAARPFSWADMAKKPKAAQTPEASS